MTGTEIPACPRCKGSGSMADYVGHEMRPVKVACSYCGGGGIVLAEPTPPACDHAHYTFKEHGRRCSCGEWMADFGD